jgi:phosphoribosyl 1,2-cyclic phosphodiesterase
MIKLTFLGTRGEIKPKTRRHRMHTALLISYKGKKIMVDCGDSWLSKLKKIKPDHILLTHAHPDHAWGLKKGSLCPVWATSETWNIIRDYPIPARQRRLIKPRTLKRIAGITFEAFPVWHSIRCPAVGYRITCKSLKFFYIPDVAYIPDIEEAFKQIQFYIGDGATLWRPMIRKNKKTGEIFGHATIRQQLTWCHKQKVPKMIITHCGADIVSNEIKRRKQIEKLAREGQIEALIAYDGMEITA